MYIFMHSALEIKQATINQEQGRDQPTINQTRKGLNKEIVEMNHATPELSALRYAN